MVAQQCSRINAQASRLAGLTLHLILIRASQYHSRPIPLSGAVPCAQIFISRRLSLFPSCSPRFRLEKTRCRSSDTNRRPPRGQACCRTVEARTYDVSEAVDAFMRKSSLPESEARAEALRQLFSPLSEARSVIKHKEVAPNRYKVWATRSFHDSFQLMIDWMKNGKKQITVEARVVTVTESTLKRLHQELGGRWELSTLDDGGIVPALDVAFRNPRSAPPISLASLPKDANHKTDHVSATSSSLRELPCRIATLQEEDLTALLGKLQTDASTNLMHAPKLTIFPGQQAEINDVSKRPFVVSVKPVEEEHGTAMQPIIKVLEEGLTIDVRATLERDGRLGFDSQITFSRIGDVDTFTFQSATVQIPEHHSRQIRLSRVVDDQATILIDPHFYEEEISKKRFRSPVTTRRYTLLFLTARIVPDTSI